MILLVATISSYISLFLIAIALILGRRQEAGISWQFLLVVLASVAWTIIFWIIYAVVRLL